MADQAPLSKEFFSQEYWSGLPFPSPGDLPNPGIKPRSPKLQSDALPSEPPRKPQLASKAKHIVLAFMNGHMEFTPKESLVSYSIEKNYFDFFKLIILILWLQQKKYIYYIYIYKGITASPFGNQSQKG